MSLSDGRPTMTMPVTPANGGGNGFGFGGDGAWFLIILFLFAFCGWGGNGWGNNGNSGGVVDGYVLSSDFANIERKMDLINGGLFLESSHLPIIPFPRPRSFSICLIEVPRICAKLFMLWTMILLRVFIGKNISICSE